MACKRIQSLVLRPTHLPSRENMMRLVHYSSEGEESPEEETYFPAEWYDAAFSKMKKWSQNGILKELDLIGGRLVNIHDHSRVFDDRLDRKMHAFKNIARVFIGHPSVQETVMRNLTASNPQYSDFKFFSRKQEREALIVNSLTKVSEILSVSAQQRKVVRHAVCPQVTQHDIWIGALMQILNGLKLEIEVMIDQRRSKELMLAQQIIVSYLKLLESATSYDPEKSSWMQVKPRKQVNSPDSVRWEDALEMSIDLINCLSEETDLSFHISKLEVMKEGLYQIREYLMDKKIGYKETQYQEYSVGKKLTKTLGHSSQCLFTLVMYYLYGTVEDIEVEVRGGVVGKGNKSCLYMGKILTVDEDKVVWNGVKQLDRVLRLFKFVRESAGMKGDMEVQGHLWCVGPQNRCFTYRGNLYFLHGINF